MKTLFIGLIALMPFSIFANDAYIANGGDKVIIVLSDNAGTMARSRAEKALVKECQDRLGGKLVGDILLVEFSGKLRNTLVGRRNSDVVTNVPELSDEDFVRLASMCVY